MSCWRSLFVSLSGSSQDGFFFRRFAGAGTGAERLRAARGNPGRGEGAGHPKFPSGETAGGGAALEGTRRGGGRPSRAGTEREGSPAPR